MYIYGVHRITKLEKDAKTIYLLGEYHHTGMRKCKFYHKPSVSFLTFIEDILKKGLKWDIFCENGMGFSDIHFLKRNKCDEFIFTRTRAENILSTDFVIGEKVVTWFIRDFLDCDDRRFHNVRFHNIDIRVDKIGECSLMEIQKQFKKLSTHEYLSRTHYHNVGLWIYEQIFVFHRDNEKEDILKIVTMMLDAYQRAVQMRIKCVNDDKILKQWYNGADAFWMNKKQCTLDFLNALDFDLQVNKETYLQIAKSALSLHKIRRRKLLRKKKFLESAYIKDAYDTFKKCLSYDDRTYSKLPYDGLSTVDVFLVDLYAMGRLNKEYIDNAIIVSGMFHNNQYLEYLKDTGWQTIFDNRSQTIMTPCVRIDKNI